MAGRRHTQHAVHSGGRIALPLLRLFLLPLPARAACATLQNIIIILSLCCVCIFASRMPIRVPFFLGLFCVFFSFRPSLGHHHHPLLLLTPPRGDRGRTATRLRTMNGMRCACRRAFVVFVYIFTSLLIPSSKAM